MIRSKDIVYSDDVVATCASFPPGYSVKIGEVLDMCYLKKERFGSLEEVRKYITTLDDPCLIASYKRSLELAEVIGFLPEKRTDGTTREEVLAKFGEDPASEIAKRSPAYYAAPSIGKTTNRKSSYSGVSYSGYSSGGGGSGIMESLIGTLVIGPVAILAVLGYIIGALPILLILFFFFGGA